MCYLLSIIKLLFNKIEHNYLRVPESPLGWVSITIVSVFPVLGLWRSRLIFRDDLLWIWHSTSLGSSCQEWLLSRPMFASSPVPASDVTTDAFPDEDTSREEYLGIVLFLWLGLCTRLSLAFELVRLGRGGVETLPLVRVLFPTHLKQREKLYQWKASWKVWHTSNWNLDKTEGCENNITMG